MRFRPSLVSVALFATVLVAQTDVPKDKEPAKCSLQGQVVQQPGGQPIRKAEIRLFGVSDERGDQTEYSAVTDAEGRFKIENVNPGAYHLYFGHADFVETEKRHYGSGMLLSLASGQEVKDLLFHMARAAVITAKVHDDDGDPQRHAQVMAVPYGNAPRGVRRRRTLDNAAQCSTNDLGECRISDLSPGRYLVAVQPEFHVPPSTKIGSDKKEQVDTTTYYPGVVDKKSAIPLELHAGDEVPISMTMGSVHAFHVRGQVANLPAWTNKEAAELILQPQDEDDEIHMPTGVLDKHGAFDIKGVVPGSYDIFVSPTTARGWLESLELLDDSKAPQAMRTDLTVEVTDEDVDNLRIAPLANGQVRGQLHMDDGQKRDWSSVYLELYADPGLPTGPAVTNGATAVVKRDGSFGTLALAGKYHLRLMRNSKLPRDYFVKTVNLGDKDVVDSGFTVGGGIFSLDVVVSPNGAAIEGVATDDKDKPAPDVSIICIPDAKRRERYDLYREITTDQLGHFSLRGLNPGEYQVFALDDDIDQDEITDPEFVRAHESLGQTVKLEQGEHKSVVLKLAAEASQP